MRVTYQLYKNGKNRELVNKSSTRPFTEFKCKSLNPVDINCFLNSEIENLFDCLFMQRML